jgi:hypothetical protein
MTSILVAAERGYAANQVRDESAVAKETEYDLEPQWTYGTMARLFSEAIELDKEPPVPADVGYHNLQIILKAYEAASAGRVLEV